MGYKYLMIMFFFLALSHSEFITTLFAEFIITMFAEIIPLGKAVVTIFKHILAVAYYGAKHLLPSFSFC